MSTSPCCTYFSSQYDGTHYNDNAQHGARYNSTTRTTLPLPRKSQGTHLSAVNVHNDRPIDSAHFAQPMSHNSTYTSPSLAHVCSDRPADSTRVVSYIRRQYVRTVPNVDKVGSSKCHTRYLATGGVARFNYVLATNSNPVTTCASDGRVNPYPNSKSCRTRSPDHCRLISCPFHGVRCPTYSGTSITGILRKLGSTVEVEGTQYPLHANLS